MGVEHQMIQEAITAAGKDFGYIRMKREQVEVVQSLVDIFGVLPTGFGKNPCYMLVF